MSALPADNYSQSYEPRIPFRPEAEVVELAARRPEAYTAPPLPEQDWPEPPQKVTPDSDSSSGTRITVGDLPGDWASVTAVWTGTPEPLSVLVERIRAARGSDDLKAIGAACWALLVAVPRGVLHLASWALEHPARTAVVAVLLAVLIATH